MNLRVTITNRESGHGSRSQAGVTVCVSAPIHDWPNDNRESPQSATHTHRLTDSQTQADELCWGSLRFLRVAGREPANDTHSGKEKI